MKTKDKALIEYAWKNADFFKRLQRQITALEKRVAELEASNPASEPKAEA